MHLRTYQAALDALDSLPQNAATFVVTKELTPLGEALQFLRRMGYRPDDLNKLNVIHVAGTKGKGSTCAYCYSLLRKTAPQLKIGLFTSPHLVSVRERIQIDGKLISSEDFARFFFEVWDKLETTKDQGHPDAPMPSPHRMLTLVAYHAFLCLDVNATILEALVGGRVDGTNVVPKPIVTGITALGIDHTSLLGNTLPEIAWHKAGIYKAGVPAYTVNQPPEALEVVKQEAEKVQVGSPLGLLKD
ncbi:unnamed protein product [Rhizoctonia solani]|uniref:Folylpoly-gamma-glutamate synthetase n=1 Tax=Rhizoctonia solani TaxID=456999 RepID=A0A8H3APP6_9AGAM|nr:unnamed protein product [Rhizoctonia solani]